MKADDKTNPPIVEVFEPGLVHIRGFLSLTEQQSVARIMMGIGKTDDYGFWRKEEDGSLALNATKTRGRIYQSMAWYNDQTKSPMDGDTVSSLCPCALKMAREADENIPDMTPSHLLTIYYATRTGIKWHRDNGENDGTAEKPVVSFSLGNACLFKYTSDVEEEDDDERENETKQEQSSSEKKGQRKAAKGLRLESGDALIFGGPARMIMHAVTKIYTGTSPLTDILGDARMNLTFREAPEVLGREEEFRYFKKIEQKRKEKEDDKFKAQKPKVEGRLDSEE